MAYRPEPAYHHGSPARTAVLLINLGTPDEPTPGAVRRYLGEFLSDPRVVEIPRWIWWLLLRVLVLPFRATRSASKYALIWTKDGSPLRVYTDKLARMLRGAFGERGHHLLVDYAMRYGQPAIGAALDRLRAQGAERILIVPLYPQYSATTTASCYDAVLAWSAQTRNVPELRFLKHYHDHPAYIAALVGQIANFWAREGRLSWTSEQPGRHSKSRLVVSFHGVPRRTLDLGDPYHCECYKTARLLGEELGFASSQIEVTFQSRFGRTQWLEPETAATLARLAKEGVTDVDVICPGFAVDCLETLEEIALEGRATFMAAGGGTFRYIPCLNDGYAWSVALAAICTEHLQGWPLTGDAPSSAAEQRARALARGASD
jgi:ferrochelatase